MAAGGQRVLVTGAGGFLGACLAHRLVAEGCDVHVLVRGGLNWRLQPLAGQLTPHAADLRDAGAVVRAVQASRPEVVFHLAAHGAYPGQADRAAILATNLLGTAHLLDALRETACRAVVNVGSSSEYGHKTRPMREDDLLEPRTDYAVGKAAATLLCQAEACAGRPVVTVRVFSAYGPWDDPGRLAPSVMAACARGEAPQVTSGWQPRDWIHADDVTELLVRAAATPAAFGRVLHAGTGVPRTVRDLVEALVRACGRDGLRPVYGARAVRPGEPACWVADIAATTRLTGWVPRLDLDEGARRTWDWYRAWSAQAAPAARAG